MEQRENKMQVTSREFLFGLAKYNSPDWSKKPTVLGSDNPEVLGHVRWPLELEGETPEGVTLHSLLLCELLGYLQREWYGL
jgi:hypothetical protein